MYLSNALSMLNRNLTRFVQSLFSVQSICTVRKGSACRVILVPTALLFILFMPVVDLAYLCACCVTSVFDDFTCKM